MHQNILCKERPCIQRNCLQTYNLFEKLSVKGFEYRRGASWFWTKVRMFYFLFKIYKPG